MLYTWLKREGTGEPNQKLRFYYPEAELSKSLHQC